jgi:Pyruvate/2-oxoacid:ferredoxin oxidoreductase delta subunit
MKRALIHPEKCKNCEVCQIEANCPNHAVIKENPEEKPWVDFYLCTGCLQCKALCLQGAVEDITQPCDGKKRMGW